MARWCAGTTSHVVPEDFNKFIKEKPEYTRKELLKWLSPEYHSEIKIFRKGEANILAEHWKKDYKIKFVDSKQAPFVQNYKPLSDQETDAMKKHINKHLGKNFIRPNSIAAAAPVLLVWKLGRGLQFCVDYCTLNEITIKNWYSIPLISETLAKLTGAVRFTKLNVIHAFNRIQIKEGQEWLTAFNTRYGQFEYLVMLFGLCNAPRTFQSYINKSLCEYLNVFCIAYLNDVLIYSSNKKDYATNVLKVLKRLREHDLQVDINKCEFSVTQMKYLYLIASTNGISMDSEKVQCILDWEMPNSVKDVQEFLRFSNFYRQFVEWFSQRMKLLTKLTKREQYSTESGKKRVKYHMFEWTEDCKKAFEDLKHTFTTAPVLAHYCEEMDSIAIEHYLTKIYTRRKEERISLCAQRYKQILASSLFVVNSLARLARLEALQDHVPTNYVRLVPWHYSLLQIAIIWSQSSRPAILANQNDSLN